jgi:hypothetical protein
MTRLLLAADRWRALDRILAAEAAALSPTHAEL